MEELYVVVGKHVDDMESFVFVDPISGSSIFPLERASNIVKSYSKAYKDVDYRPAKLSFLD